MPNLLLLTSQWEKAIYENKQKPKQIMYNKKSKVEENQSEQNENRIFLQVQKRLFERGFGAESGLRRESKFARYVEEKNLG